MKKIMLILGLMVLMTMSVVSAETFDLYFTTDDQVETIGSSQVYINLPAPSIYETTGNMYAEEIIGGTITSLQDCIDIYPTGGANANIDTDWDIHLGYGSACYEDSEGTIYFLDVNNWGFFGPVNISVTYEVSNSPPVINSITPNTRIELTQGDSQLYTSDVTDDDGDASYSWTLGSTEVSTGTTYTANWEDIEPGIYTLTLNVSDAEYSDTASTTLEIRAVGGSSSLSIITPEVVEEEQEYEVTADQATPQTSAFSKFTGNVGNFFSSIGSWFGGLFR